MHTNFWKKLQTPFFALAPMYDVTDAAFRKIITKYSSPDVIFTEFVNVDGLLHPEGYQKLKHHLRFSQKEHPIVLQVFGTNPHTFKEIAQLCQSHGFDGIDINMGCPEKNIVKQGAGSDLINNPSLAKDIICATIEGAGSMPVSVKTRIGFNQESIQEWIPSLLTQDIAALTVHLRTRKEMSRVPAQWEQMHRIVTMRDDINPSIRLVGNGDVCTKEQGEEYAKKYGCDGIMIGRGVFGNPWVFGSMQSITVKQKLEVLVEHTMLFDYFFAGKKNFSIMKKHYKAYVNGFDNAVALRSRLMDAQNAQQVQEIVESFLQQYKM